MVSTTYGHGFFDDLGASTFSDWVEDIANFNNMLIGHGTQTTDNADYFKIAALFDGGAGVDEWCYYENDITNISSTTYTQFLIRWKTSEASAGAMAKVVLDFTVGDQTILPSSYSTDWTVSTGTITSGKTIDKVHLYADDDGTDGTFYVWYDFVLLCKGAFDFPHSAHGIRTDFPPKEAFLPIPSKDTDITQNLGTGNAVVNIGCNLDIGDWKRAGPVDNKDGDVFKDIHHNRSTEPWQWLDYDEGQMKATIHPQFSTVPSGGRLERRVDLTCTEYSLGDKADETYVERYGLNL